MSDVYKRSLYMCYLTGPEAVGYPRYLLTWSNTNVQPRRHMTCLLSLSILYYFWQLKLVKGYIAPFNAKILNDI